VASFREERIAMTASTAEDLYEIAKSLPASERRRLVEKLTHDLTHSTAFAAGPPLPTELTVADLLRLLSSAPQPDDGYADDVEAVVQSQPEVPRSPWSR
jgi:hypothetical protein